MYPVKSCLLRPGAIFASALVLCASWAVPALPEVDDGGLVLQHSAGTAMPVRVAAVMYRQLIRASPCAHPQFACALPP